jgi:low temperature requirement protein LtrA
MAISVRKLSHRKQIWFAISYVAVRSIGLLDLFVGSWEDAAMRTAVKTFGVVSVAGLIAVLAGGYFGRKFNSDGWGVAILLDIIAAGIGGRNSHWNFTSKALR